MMNISLYGQDSNDMSSLCMLPKEIDRIIAQNLKRIRKQKGLTQEQLGDLIEIGGNQIAQYEGAIIGMGKDIMARLCTSLKVRPHEFYVENTTPVVSADREKDAVFTIREAEHLGVAEDIVKYGRFLVQDAKRTKKK